MNKLFFPSFPGCFVCGRDNPRGIRLPLWREGEETRGEFDPEKELCGFSGVIHGGVIAAVLDEILWWTTAIEKRCAVVTKSISITYIRPVILGNSYNLAAEASLTDGREITGKAVMKIHGRIFARADGIYVPAPSGMNEQLLEGLVFLDREGREIPHENRFGPGIFENP